MDPDKLLKFFTENLTDWSRVTFLTLVHPISRFELVVSSDGKTQALAGTFQSERQMWLSPRLLSFAVLSVILGTAINSLLPNRVPGPQLFVTVSLVLISWFFHASFLHIVCRALRGSGHYIETISVSLQLFATIYVVSSFLSLVVATVISTPTFYDVTEQIPFIGQLIVEEPALLFFLIGALLHSIYIPLSLRPVHKFGWLRVFIIFLITSMLILISLWYISVPVYHRTGVMMPVPMK